MPSLTRRIKDDEIELIQCIKKYIDERWDNLNDWEKRFIEDIIARFDQYNSNMYVSDKVIKIILDISEKII